MSAGSEKVASNEYKATISIQSSRDVDQLTMLVNITTAERRLADPQNLSKVPSDLFGDIGRDLLPNALDSAGGVR
jgi:hypothetical protein